MLDTFITTHSELKKGEPLRVLTGADPVAEPIQSVQDNLLLVGDAARQVDPITGGGLMHSIEAGKYAGQTIGKAVKKQSFTAQTLSEYEALWKEAFGKKLHRNYIAKEIMARRPGRRAVTMSEDFDTRVKKLLDDYERLVTRRNDPVERTNGLVQRWKHPVLTAAHTPPFWRYDLDPATNPLLLERLGINAVFNPGAIFLDGKFILVARVEGVDRKSFFAVAESLTGVDSFRFWDYPVVMPETDEPDVNVYDMRLVKHEDGHIYGLLCTERKDPAARRGDLTSAVAQCGIPRTRDLGNFTYRDEAKGIYRHETTLVGSFPPNAFGLYDMHGNVWEWCADGWHADYAGAPGDGSVWERPASTLKVLRGGCWHDPPDICCSAARLKFPQNEGEDFVGFRVALSSPDKGAAASADTGKVMPLGLSVPSACQVRRRRRVSFRTRSWVPPGSHARGADGLLEFQ